jgi:hypothetical protein
MCESTLLYLSVLSLLKISLNNNDSIDDKNETIVVMCIL